MSDTDLKSEGIAERLRADTPMPQYGEGFSRAPSPLQLEAAAEIERLKSELKAIREKTIEECASIADAQAIEYLSPEYATGQPLSSFSERFACGQIAEAIRVLKGSGT